MKTKYIVYSGDLEVLVTTLDSEQEMLDEYFINGGRNVDEYDRVEVADHTVEIYTKLYCG